MDAATIEEIGLPGIVLMETAGRRVADAVLEHLTPEATRGPVRDRPHVAVVCGAGNNGGDGYVIARCLREAGLNVAVYLLAPDGKVRGDAARHLDVYRQVGGVVVAAHTDEALAAHRRAIEHAAVVVDAIFGTGLAREVTGRYRDAIEIVNRSRGTVVAVDIPSGLSADTGQVLGVAVRAQITVTMAFLKTGIASAPGFAYAGDTRVAEIGIPAQLAQAHDIRVALLEDRDLSALLAPLPLVVHKNRRGHALIVAGSPGKRGAGRLAAWACLRAGAGLVTLAGPEISGEIAAPDPIMTANLDPDRVKEPGRALVELARDRQAVAIGPGMPTGRTGRELVRGALQELDVPVVFDADALGHLAGKLDWVRDGRPPAVLTPHPGEAARLLGLTNAAITNDRVAAVRRLARESQAVVVLKGARTLVCDGVADDDFVTINPTGNPGLATAGTGDVLTGIIAGLVAQGLAPANAARLGAYLHGASGDLAAAELGARSVTASDLTDYLPRAMCALDQTAS